MESGRSELNWYRPFVSGQTKKILLFDAPLSVGIISKMLSGTETLSDSLIWAWQWQKQAICTQGLKPMQLIFAAVNWGDLWEQFKNVVPISHLDSKIC